MSLLRSLFQRRKVQTCPVCGCDNYTEHPVRGHADQRIVGYDRHFACGFEMTAQGTRNALCEGHYAKPAVAVSAAVNGAATHH